MKGYVTQVAGRGTTATLALERAKIAVEPATMFCSAGRRGLEIEIAPADLIRAAGAKVAAIAAAESQKN